MRDCSTVRYRPGGRAKWDEMRIYRDDKLGSSWRGRCRVMGGGFALGAVFLGGTVAMAAEVGLEGEVLDGIELRYLEGSDESLTLREGLEHGVMSFGEHLIEQDDSYASIIERNGLRADPNSIDFYRSLNSDRFSVRALPLGKVLTVLISEDPNRLAIEQYPQLKAKVIDAQLGLREIRDELSGRAKTSEVAEVKQASDVIGDIVSMTQQLEVAGYAVEPPVLEATGDALEEVGDIGRELIELGRRPTSEDLQIMTGTLDGVSRANIVARDIDGARTRTHIKTIDSVAKERHGLTVCFRDAMDLRLFRIRQGHNADPDWRCDHTFDDMSSPARKQFEPRLQFVVWATRGVDRVSAFRIVEIEANREDGTYWYELLVDME